MLTDKSDNFEETMRFVDRRMEDLKVIDDNKQSIGAFLTSLYVMKNSYIEMLKPFIVEEALRGVREDAERVREEVLSREDDLDGTNHESSENRKDEVAGDGEKK